MSSTDKFGQDEDIISQFGVRATTRETGRGSRHVHRSYDGHHSSNYITQWTSQPAGPKMTVEERRLRLAEQHAAIDRARAEEARVKAEHDAERVRLELELDAERKRREMILELEKKERERVRREEREEAERKERARAAETEQAAIERLFREQRLLEEKRERRLQAEAEMAQQVDKLECKVCLSAVASFVVVPCGHMCLCSECVDDMFGAEDARDFERSPCPVCRNDVTKVIRVFV